MRVSQLIEQLMAFNLDVEVVVRDREGELIGVDIGVMPVHDHEQNAEVMVNLVVNDQLIPDLSHNRSEMVRQLARREYGVTSREVVDAGYADTLQHASMRLNQMVAIGKLHQLPNKRNNCIVYINRK